MGRKGTEKPNLAHYDKERKQNKQKGLLNFEIPQMSCFSDSLFDNYKSLITHFK